MRAEQRHHGLLGEVRLEQSALHEPDLVKDTRLLSILVDLPVWIINSLDKEAKRLGVTRQSMIKVWIAERLQKR